jgi:hypothetical protein
MRKTKTALVLALDMLNETELVKKSVENAVGVLSYQRFEVFLVILKFLIIAWTFKVLI